MPTMTDADGVNLFGEYLDAQQRLMAAGYSVTYDRFMSGGRTYRVTARDSAGRTADWAKGPTLTHATVRLADRLAPGAK
jgi:hypothetical protein